LTRRMCIGAGNVHVGIVANQTKDIMPVNSFSKLFSFVHSRK